MLKVFVFILNLINLHLLIGLHVLVRLDSLFQLVHVGLLLINHVLQIEVLLDLLVR